jgi:hypothetical protein
MYSKVFQVVCFIQVFRPKLCVHFPYFSCLLHEVSSALKMEAVCSSETLVGTKKSHGVITRNTNTDIVTAVRTSNLRKCVPTVPVCVSFALVKSRCMPVRLSLLCTVLFGMTPIGRWSRLFKYRKLNELPCEPSEVRTRVLNDEKVKQLLIAAKRK